MAQTIVYREQLIGVFSSTDVSYFLFDEYGDIDEYHANSLEQAKQKIDEFYKEHNGFYGAGGELYQE